MKLINKILGIVIASSLIFSFEVYAEDELESTFTPRSILRLGDGLFVLRDPLTFKVGGSGKEISVPSGFVTDLASIPKPLHWWEGKVDRSMAPAILHDYLYWYQPCTCLLYTSDAADE